jgi:hypothetical protein
MWVQGASDDGNHDPLIVTTVSAVATSTVIVMFLYLLGMLSLLSTAWCPSILTGSALSPRAPPATMANLAGVMPVLFDIRPPPVPRGAALYPDSGLVHACACREKCVARLCDDCHVASSPPYHSLSCPTSVSRLIRS